ncbi:MAG: hypothetical protein H0T72_03570 [Chloroflexia bacterium]|nr:hypothetical protein [Chloroflexia bacterium]
MTPVDIIRRAAAAGIDLTIEAGKLVAASRHGPPPMDVLATIKAHKPGIIAALESWPECATLRTVTVDRCRPLTPDDLPGAERIEAESLATELAQTGGLGQFVICLTGRWNDLADRDRLAAAYAWQVATGAQESRDADRASIVEWIAI